MELCIKVEEKFISKRKLKSLLLQGKDISYIAAHLNVGRATIRNKIDKYDLEEAREKGQRKLLQKEAKDFVKLFLQLNGIKAIARKLHKGPIKVKKVLQELGFTILPAGKWTKVVNHVKNKEFYLPISDYLLEAIIGELLGDGSIQLQIKGEKVFFKNLDVSKYFEYILFLRSFYNMDKIRITPKLKRTFNEAIEYVSRFSTAKFRYHVSIEEKPWNDHLCKLFTSEGYKCYEFVKEKKVPTLLFDKTCGFESYSSVQLFDIYSLWYPNNKKRVPRNLILTPNILLHWYIGDGSLSTGSLYISSQSFTEEDNNFLVDLLKKYVGIECKVRSTKDGFVIAVSLKKENLNKFFDYLEKADSTSLKIAKETFPWKFDRYLSFKKHLKSKK